jgi:hypothetical protein
MGPLDNIVGELLRDVSIRIGGKPKLSGFSTFHFGTDGFELAALPLTADASRVLMPEHSRMASRRLSTLTWRRRDGKSAMQNETPSKEA